MRNRLFCVLASVLILGGASPAFAQQDKETEERATPAAPVPAPVAPLPTPTPSVSAINPAAPLVAPNQAVTLTGSNFQKGIVVTFIDPEGNSYPATAEILGDANRAVTLANLGVAGTWKVIAHNPGGSESHSFEFPVANTPSLSYTSPALWAFVLAAVVVTCLIRAIYCFITDDLRRAQAAGNWSFGDALSEESMFQPAVIQTKRDVIMIASSSRLIALLGMLGILMIVVGVGYAVVWNLFIHGTVPDLVPLRSFLYGTACLFAPYLANKLSGIFSPKPKLAATSGAETREVLIKGIAPSAPCRATTEQALHLLGQGFQAGSAIIFSDPLANDISVSGAAITGIDPALVSCSVLLNTAGSWKVRLINPGASASNDLQFAVFGAPDITGVETAVTANAAAQSMTFTGSGFMSGLNVTLTPPGGGKAQTIEPTAVTATRVTISAVFSAGGNWEVKVTNPKKFASAPYILVVR
jgi:hypothetical protein